MCRHFKVRVGENSGISPLTNKRSKLKKINSRQDHMLIRDIPIIILKSISIFKQFFLFFKKIHSQFFGTFSKFSVFLAPDVSHVKGTTQTYSTFLTGNLIFSNFRFFRKNVFSIVLKPVSNVSKFFILTCKRYTSPTNKMFLCQVFQLLFSIKVST